MRRQLLSDVGERSKQESSNTHQTALNQEKSRCPTGAKAAGLLTAQDESL